MIFLNTNPSNKTQALTKRMNMEIEWYINQLFIGAYHNQIKFSKLEVTSGKTTFFGGGSFGWVYLALPIIFDRGFLCENDAFSIAVCPFFRGTFTLSVGFKMKPLRIGFFLC